MSKFALKLIMQAAHRQAGIWVRNGYTDSYAIALSVALKAEWAAKRKSASIRAAQEARRAAKQHDVERAGAMNTRPARIAYNSRRIMPLSVAQRDGLNHGRSWYCGERDIEAKGAMPEWEGDLICYVYA